MAGGAVALGGAKLTGYGEGTTTVRVVNRDSASGQSQVASQSRPRSALTIGEIYSRAAPGDVQVTTTSKVESQTDPFFGFDVPDEDSYNLLAEYAETSGERTHVHRGSATLHGRCWIFAC